jgi:hypothetical protein
MPEELSQPSDDDADELQHRRKRRGADDPEHDLFEDLPPPPDSLVIRKEDRKDKERGWFLRIFLGLLVLTVAADLAGSAFLPTATWTQMKPEVADVRTWLFQVTGVVIGFYFGTNFERSKK